MADLEEGHWVLEGCPLGDTTLSIRTGKESEGLVCEECVPVTPSEGEPPCGEALQAVLGTV